MSPTMPARELGPRGSRGTIAGPDPAGPISREVASVIAAVPGWWYARAHEAGLSGRWLDVENAIDAPLPENNVPTGETAFDADASAEEVGAAYVAALTPSVRARHGRHYTPSLLAGHLWAMTRSALGLGARASRLPGLVRDRACGSGALLLPPLREHLRAVARSDESFVLAGLRNVVEGIDSDPVAVWLATVVLAAETLPVVAALPVARRQRVPALAKVGDGLAPADRRARVEIQNPPYGRVRLDAEERERWRRALFGHANLYGLFLAAAAESVDAEGVVAAVVPTSFTSGLYFSRLREMLSTETPLRSAAFVTDRDGVFADVLQETCLVVFARRRSRLTSIASVNGHATPVARVASPRGSRAWLLPRRADDAAVAAAAAALPNRLSDIGYRCSTGPLVWNRRAADLDSKPSESSIPVVWGADIDGGQVHRDPARDERRFLRLGEGDDSLVLDEPAVLVQRTTAPEQTRRLVAAELSQSDLDDWGGRVAVENHVNVIRAFVEEPILDATTLTAVLSSSIIDRVVRSLSGSVAVSAYEIESIPFPSATTLKGWNGLTGDALERAVAAAYRPSE